MTKKAFVTGASRGIGRGIALKLAAAGYDIAFTYHSEVDEADTLKTMIESLGQKAFYYQASFSHKDVSIEITKKAIDDLDGLDVLVCNAGKTKFTSIQSLDIDDMDFIYHLNYQSYLIQTHIAINHMIKHQTKGRIIYITSTRGIRAYPNDVIYGSLKAALNRAVESLALELAPYDITVNAVAPGATAVRGDLSDEGLRQGHIPSIIPLKRRGHPDDVAGLVSYLVSDDASYITGETIKVDGGLILYGPDEKFKGGAF
ncbi:MAG: SDR family NAD(P)-dependent oxidoreductase [Acholeplasmataceae bacterium]